MTDRDEIIRMAREVGLYSGNPLAPSTARMVESRLERFAALVAAAEREACAIAGAAAAMAGEDYVGVAAAIRARNKG